MNTVWISAIVSIPISLACGVIVALYTRDLLDWKEARAKRRSMRKAERAQDFQRRVLSYVSDDHSLTRFLLFAALRLALGLGTITLGLLLTSICQLIDLRMHVPGAPVIMGAAHSAISSLFFVSGAASGALVGFGGSMLWWLVSDAINLRKALHTVSSDLPAATPTTNLAMAGDQPRPEEGA